VPLSENKAGLTVEVTYGMVVDTKRKKWIIADVKKEKKLHTFSGIDFSYTLRSYINGTLVWQVHPHMQ
jgi:hypothetical protein